MNYEQYHQKGGTYVLPVEVFDNLLDEKEELEKENKKLKEQLNKKEIKPKIGNLMIIGLENFYEQEIKEKVNEIIDYINEN